MIFNQIRYVKSPVTPIRIITINTWKCDGPYRARIPLLADQLEALKPDIIACQECFQSNESQADTLKYLANHLQMNSSFLPGRHKIRTFEGRHVDSYSGLGVLSRFPLKAVADFALPHTPGDDERKLQLVQVDLPEPLLLANIHLTHIRDAEDHRAQQAYFVSEKIAAYPHRYRFVCGDFNAQLGSNTLNAFAEIAHTLDCYAAGNGSEPRYSVTDAYYSGKLVCIDHILSLPYPGTNDYHQFENSAIVLNERVDGIYPSDHFGIATTLITDSINASN